VKGWRWYVAKSGHGAKRHKSDAVQIQSAAWQMQFCCLMSHASPERNKRY